MIAPSNVVLWLPAEPSGPPFDGLARAAASFVDCAAPHTPADPALATLITGRDVFAHRVAADGDTPDPIVPTLPALLAERGVHTVLQGGASDWLVGDFDAVHMGSSDTAIEACRATGRPYFLLTRGESIGELDAATLSIVLDGHICILTWPGRLPERCLATPTRTLDVAPTILDALGLTDLAVEHWLPGTSLLPLCSQAEPRPTYRELYLTAVAGGVRRRGWRNPDWLLYETLGEAPTVVLHRPGDSVDLAAERPEVVAELHRRLHGHVRRRVAETGRPDPLVEARTFPHS